jgi:hypothetical protein
MATCAVVARRQFRAKRSLMTGSAKQFKVPKKSLDGFCLHAKALPAKLPSAQRSPLALAMTPSANQCP